MVRKPLRQIRHGRWAITIVVNHLRSTPAAPLSGPRPLTPATGATGATAPRLRAPAAHPEPLLPQKRLPVGRQKRQALQTDLRGWALLGLGGMANGSQQLCPGFRGATMVNGLQLGLQTTCHLSGHWSLGKHRLQPDKWARPLRKVRLLFCRFKGEHGDTSGLTISPTRPKPWLLACST